MMSVDSNNNSKVKYKFTIIDSYRNYERKRIKGVSPSGALIHSSDYVNVINDGK